MNGVSGVRILTLGDKADCVGHADRCRIPVTSFNLNLKRGPTRRQI